MAGELQIDAPIFTGSTLYAFLFNEAGEVYDTAGTNFEDFVDAQIANYNIAMIEQGTASGFFRGDMPAVAAGVYGFSIREQYGGAAAITDLTIGTGHIEWDGTDEIGLDSLDISGTIIEGTVTLKQAIAAILAKAIGNGTGGGTASLLYKNQAGDTNRITMTILNVNGDRTVALDFSDL